MRTVVAAASSTHDARMFELRLSPSRLFLAGIGVPVDLFVVGDFHLAFDHLDRSGNGLFGVRNVRFTDKKLHIIADLETCKRSVPVDIIGRENVFRTVLDGRNEPPEFLSLQFRDEAMLKRCAIGGVACISRRRIWRRSSVALRVTIFRGRLVDLDTSSPRPVGLRVQFVLNRLPFGQRLERSINHQRVKKHIGTADSWLDKTKTVLGNQCSTRGKSFRKNWRSVSKRSSES